MKQDKTKQPKQQERLLLVGGRRYNTLCEAFADLRKRSEEERKVRALERLAEALERQGKQTEEPQQGDLHYYCQKAIKKGYLNKVDGGYRRATWSKAQLAYFLKNFPNADGTFPDKEYCVMFGESRLSKAADQLTMNKNGDGKPRGYEKVDELFQE